MYELYYKNEDNQYVQIMVSENKQDCLDRAALDGQQSYMIEFEVDGVVLSVESC